MHRQWAHKLVNDEVVSEILEVEEADALPEGWHDHPDKCFSSESEEPTEEPTEEPKKKRGPGRPRKVVE